MTLCFWEIKIYKKKEKTKNKTYNLNKKKFSKWNKNS